MKPEQFQTGSKGIICKCGGEVVVKETELCCKECGKVGHNAWVPKSWKSEDLNRQGDKAR